MTQINFKTHHLINLLVPDTVLGLGKQQCIKHKIPTPGCLVSTERQKVIKIISNSDKRLGEMYTGQQGTEKPDLLQQKKSRKASLEFELRPE